VPHARRTRRFADVIHWLGYAWSGRGSERLLDRLGLTVSDDTIWRMVFGAALARVFSRPPAGIAQHGGVGD
jgi:hypothetical protein